MAATYASFYVDPGSQTRVLVLKHQAFTNWVVSSVLENNLLIVIWPGAVQLNYELQINPCFVQLVDVKKENSSFSLAGNQQTRARTNQNEDSEIIELSSGDSDNGENFSEATTTVPSQPGKETQVTRQAVDI